MLGHASFHQPTSATPREPHFQVATTRPTFSSSDGTKGSDVCVDLTITSPLVLDVYPLNIERARRHLNNAERDKRDQSNYTNVTPWVGAIIP